MTARASTNHCRSAVASIVLGVVFAACETVRPLPVLPPGHVALPYAPSPCASQAPGEPLCVLGQRGFDGTLKEGDGCLWLEMDNGDEVAILWPAGYSATHNPLTIFDNEGREVARANDRLSAGGGGPYSGDADACGRRAYVVLIHPMSRVDDA